jgi:hypothetical protein
MHIASEHIRAERALLGGSRATGASVMSAPVVAEAAGAQAWASIGSRRETCKENEGTGTMR